MFQLSWAPGKGVKGKVFKDYWELEEGVSYIPWPKIPKNVDIELLEDGGMIDEETLPDWMKEKMENSANSNPNSQSLLGLALDNTSIGNAAAIIPPVIDTSQPPPMPPSAGLLQPPPALPLSLVNPFQLNNRLALGMNLSAGMIPPMGVPPPNLMTNPLLGLGSTFAQAPPTGMYAEITYVCREECESALESVRER